MPTSGFLLSNAAAVTFRDCSVTWGPNPPDYFKYALDAAAMPGTRRLRPHRRGRPARAAGEVRPLTAQA
jgi:hypothetical protein